MAKARFMVIALFNPLEVAWASELHLKEFFFNKFFKSSVIISLPCVQFYYSKKFGLPFNLGTIHGYPRH